MGLRGAARRTVLACAAVALATLAACSSNTSGQARTGDTTGAATSAASSAATSAAASAPAASSSAGSSPAAAGAASCVWGQAQGTEREKHVSKPATTRPPRTGTVAVSISTNRGPITLMLNRAVAPCTVESFVSLVKQKFYDDTHCHRLTTEGIFVLQCGDPSGQGIGGPGYTVPDEATGTEQYPAGTIAMARTQQPDSGGSQFFIVTKDSPQLQQGLGAQQYTVFGRVSAGMSVVAKVAAAGSDDANGPGDGAPKLSLQIQAMNTSG